VGAVRRRGTDMLLNACDVLTRSKTRTVLLIRTCKVWSNNRIQLKPSAPTSNIGQTRDEDRRQTHLHRHRHPYRLIARTCIASCNSAETELLLQGPGWTDPCGTKLDGVAARFGRCCEPEMKTETETMYVLGNWYRDFL
jgi:hypothetical protein